MFTALNEAINIRMNSRRVFKFKFLTYSWFSFFSDLVYKLTLKQEGWVDSRPATIGSLSEARPGSASRSSFAQIKLLEAQLSEAQTKLGEVVSRNQYLTNVLLDMRR